MRLIFSILLLLTSISSYASHIAGGEFSYEYLGKDADEQFRYRVTFTLYQDCVSGDNEAIRDDNPAFFTIFNSSNIGMYSTEKINASSTKVPVEYGVDPFCYDNLPQLCLQKAIFIFEITLPSESDPDYDPNGYIIAYQRCCRNKVISNISNPGSTGSTFYTSIPAGEANANNSPVYNAPPPLLICLNYPQLVDYGAVDADGDSLVYKFCVSNSGASGNQSKPNVSSPPPFPVVQYRNGYTFSNPIGSSVPPNLNSKTGLLEFTPTQLGIFAVVICIEEYRNGVLIGTHRRETQFYVTNCSKKSYAQIPYLSWDPETHQIVCDGYTVTFDNTSKGATSYFWEFGDPSSLYDTSSLAYPTYTYPDTGTYLVNLYTDREKDCPDSSSKYVKIYPYFEADFTIDGIQCSGETITFEDSTFSTYGEVTSRFWSFGDGNYAFDDETVYHIYENETKDYPVYMAVENNFGCRDTAYKNLQIYGIDIFAGNDTIVVINTPVTVNARGELNSNWSPNLYIDDVTKANPTFIFPQPGVYTYYLTTSNELGCTATDSIVITATDKAYFFIPTAFTPNGDGLNDIVEIVAAGMRRLLSFDIYNRWGENVFNSANIKKHWDGIYRGQELPIGTYFWVADAIDLSNNRVRFSGEISIIR